jgi:predicted O-methyltransferase YrrM
MFLSKAESTLKGLLSPIGHRRLNRMLEAGFPAHLTEPLRFLFSSTSYGTVQNVEKIRSEITEKGKPYIVVRSSGLDTGSQTTVLVERKLEWLVEIASITKYWGTFLHLCAKATKAETILELGACVGLSSCYLASTESCKNFITIEGSDGLVRLIESNLRKVSNNFKVVHALFDSGLDEVLPTLESGLDLVFIDGDHTKAATLHYFQRIKPFLNRGSVILFDDIHWSKEMFQAWREVCESPGLSFTVNLGRLGLCIWDEQSNKPVNYNLSKFTKEWGRGG